MNDPVRDLRDELVALRGEVDLSDVKVAARLDRMEKDINRIENLLSGFVPFIRYINVERIVFGMVALILVSVVTALMALVVAE
jgi:hypothetical protein